MSIQICTRTQLQVFNLTRSFFLLLLFFSLGGWTIFWPVFRSPRALYILPLPRAWKAHLLPVRFFQIIEYYWLSGLVQQISVRIEQAIFLSRKSRMLVHGHDTSTTQYFSSQYNKHVLSAISLDRFSSPCIFSFYNSVWLISNDIIIGAAFGAFLCENNAVLARLGSSAFEVRVIFNYCLVHELMALLSMFWYTVYKHLWFGWIAGQLAWSSIQS